MANCRSCEAPLSRTFVDLGVSPLANSYLQPKQLAQMEPFFPLQVLLCESCLLVQLDEFESPEAIFSDYAYFSSFSETWLAHAQKYVADVVERFALDKSKFVVEVASNDGYLIKNFKAREIPLLGIEPAKNVSDLANKLGIRTQCDFFGPQVAEKIRAQFGPADLMVANNVLAHVPRLNDFLSAFKLLLAPEGVITFEFPHLLHLIRNGQFDTIYHEHFCYFSLISVSQAISRQGLRVFDAETLSTHGGSLRLYVCHEESASFTTTPRVHEVRQHEESLGLHQLRAYEGFSETVSRIKRDLLRFLIAVRDRGERVAAYGAPAKGNTLLNYCGIRSDFIEFTVDRSPHKQGTFLPGTRIPVFAPEALYQRKPDYLFILPWNLEAEIIEQCKAIREWGGRFVVSHPSLRIIP